LTDPTGRLVTLVRDAPTVSTITSRVRGGEKAPGDAPPYIVLVPLASSPFLGTPETQRTGVATWRHAIRCYGPRVQGGDRQALALALAVVSVLHMAGPVPFTVAGKKNAIYQIAVEAIGPILVDPDSGEPYAVVTTTLAASAQALN
jgi:hypothetical protein